jgi:homopolymeric O-antigen transport system ATP-binding protein
LFTTSKILPMTAFAVRFENVVQRFRVIQERPDTLREAFSRFHRRRTTYHDFEALKHISFEVPRGTTVGIIGRNGSGKSTILKIMAGVYRPSSGTVEVNGSIAPLIELGAGFHHELTGRENILINGLLLGLSKAEIERLEPSIIEFAEIGEFIDAPVKQYSSGMYMRLAFSVATAVDPDILLVDEILAVGDAGFREKCNQRIDTFRRAGKSIVLVSHDQETIRKFCERVLLLDRGELVADGSPETVLARYGELIGHPELQGIPAIHHN